ncbi:MAG TPA: hypothetical protein PK671_16920 [Candidatus Obscuribacter sp.]|nr:hypothetical protein [Candidatus Obscuribacter sp.]
MKNCDPQAGEPRKTQDRQVPKNPPFAPSKRGAKAKSDGGDKPKKDKLAETSKAAKGKTPKKVKPVKPKPIKSLRLKKGQSIEVGNVVFVLKFWTCKNPKCTCTKKIHCAWFEA